MQPDQPQQPQQPQQPFPQQQPQPFPQQPFPQQSQEPNPGFTQPPFQAQAQPQAPQPAPMTFPAQPNAPVLVGSAMGQNYQPPKAPSSKLWIWLVAIGVPVLAIIGVAIFLLIPKGSPTAWCDTEYKMTQAMQNTSMSSGSDSDKKAALAKARDYMKQLQSTAPSEIKKDVATYAGYRNRFLDAYEKIIDSHNTLSLSAGADAAVDLPTPTSEESTASTNIMKYTQSTCTSDGKVKTSN